MTWKSVTNESVRLLKLHVAKVWGAKHVHAKNGIDVGEDHQQHGKREYGRDDADNPACSTWFQMFAYFEEPDDTEEYGRAARSG